MKPAYIGLDIETTGLDPHNDSILEVGVGFFDTNLNLIHVTSQVIGYDQKYFTKMVHSMPEVVKEMHTKNGLIDDILTSDNPRRREVEDSLCDLIDEYTDEQLPMLGSSITFDRSFLDEYMPKLHQRFHYRSLDATSAKFAALSQFHEENQPEIETAISDLSESLTHAMIEEHGLSKDVAIPHRAAYDLIASAALVKSSMAMVKSLGFHEKTQ
ncbi:exonuclease domain-containing protein [Corynebacterium glutamicum]|uniref:exonuclease domain-containing protein n=1 Tax=Corynebacterium glutamicum TaxID=1718 RepID=UPI0007C605AE|nr:exonuclease domain-containing protein [Corynebacterium glutamicum]ANE09035.1 hypothetical protein A3654_11975 [Corynebacterium glutamicum]